MLLIQRHSSPLALVEEKDRSQLAPMVLVEKVERTEDKMAQLTPTPRPPIDEPLESIPDRALYNRVVSILGLVIVLVLVGAFTLLLLGKPVEQGILIIGSAAIGGLVGLLAPSPKEPVRP
jgi:hypothetical protein